MYCWSLLDVKVNPESGADPHSLNSFQDLNLPTRARMTVSKWAAGKAMVMFISNI